MDTPVRVKICGLTRNDDALRAEALGADYLGTVLTAGFGRSVEPGHAAEVVEGTRIPRVAVLVDEAPEAAAERARAVGASVVQLHGAEERRVVEAIRAMDEWILWKAVRARSVDDVRRTVDGLGDLVDGILVEGWRAGVVGGGGVRVSIDPEGVRAAIPPELAFILAGGLEPGSVAEAVARFRPDVVDVSSGVERSPGVKSAERVEAFIRASRAAFTSSTVSEPPERPPIP